MKLCYRYVVLDDGTKWPRIHSKTQRLPNPHYSNEIWKEPRVVFGKHSNDLGYDYDDRLMGWDGYERGVTVAKENGIETRTVQWFEAVMSEMFGREINIKCVQAGVNLSNGYGYYVLGYETQSKK